MKRPTPTAVLAIPKKMASNEADVEGELSMDRVANKTAAHTMPPAKMDHRHHRPKTSPKTIIVGITPPHCRISHAVCGRDASDSAICPYASGEAVGAKAVQGSAPFRRTPDTRDTGCIERAQPVIAPCFTMRLRGGYGSLACGGCWDRFRRGTHAGPHTLKPVSPDAP
jgi:hypothetical protein